MSDATTIRTDVTFASGETFCAGWRFDPPGLTPGERRPAVLLGHGLGAIKEMGLDRYAERFAAAGYVAIAFDYRHFGASGGEPRQLLDHRRQVEDFAAAVTYTRGLEDVDPARIALFGTSFGGGNVIAAAARDPRVAAAIAQCPFTDGLRSALTIDPKGTLGVTALALRDLAGAALGRRPVRVRLAAEPGHAALMNARDALPGYMALVPDGVHLDDRVAARVALQIPLLRPGAKAKRVPCPIYFAVCEPDSVAPTKPTLRYAAQAPKGEVKRYPVGHFAIYDGPMFEEAVGDYVDFLQRHLPVGG